MTDHNDPSQLVDLGIDSLTMNDIETVLDAERTGIDITYDGDSFLSPSSDRVQFSKTRARYFDSLQGRCTEVSFKVSFVVTPDDFEVDDSQVSGET